MLWLELHGFARGDRHSAVARIRFALTGGGACITAHQQFSNVSLCIGIEIDGARLPALASELRAAGVALDARSEAALAAAAPGEWRGSLQITFVHDEPDLPVPPPAVPG